MAQPDVDAFLNEATASLAADPELHLEQRCELAARLDQLQAARLAAGQDAAAATAAAMQELGAPADLAATFLATHRARMTRRARARLLLRWLLVPAALLAALWPTAAILLDRPGNLLPLLAVTMPEPRQGFDFYRALLQDRLPLDAPTPPGPVAGGADTPTKAENARAQWQRDPADRVLLGNHITLLVCDQVTDATEAPAREAYLRELAAAEAADPGNARYAYLAAKAWLDAGCKLLDRKGPPDPEGKTTYYFDLEITDRDAFDRGLAELRRGLAMPRFERYIAAMLRRRLDAMPEPHDRLSALARVDVASSVPLPDLGRLRYLARVANTHGRDLLAAGQVDAARPLLDASPILARHLNGDSCFGIDAMVVFSLGTLGKPAAEAYAAAGMTEEAAAREAVVAQVRQVEDNQRTMARGSYYWQPYAGIVGNRLLLQRYGFAPTPEELRHDRLTDYIELDRLTLEVTILALVVALVVAMLAAVRWRRPRGGEVCPILLLPRWPQAARVLAWGIGVPLAAYLVLTLTPLGGRGQALHEAWPRAMLLALLLAAAIVIGTLMASRRLVRRRCQALGLAVPPPGSAWWRTSLLLLAGGVMLFALLPPESLDLSPAYPDDAFSALASILDDLELAKVQQAMLPAVAALLGVSSLVAAGSLLAGPSRFGLYTGTLARSLLPLLAGAILLLCLLRPAGAARESWLVRHDPLRGATATSVGLTALEDRMVQRLQADLAQALVP
jgi:hypothetical protein